MNMIIKHKVEVLCGKDDCVFNDENCHCKAKIIIFSGARKDSCDSYIKTNRKGKE